ncbi:MAG: MFS transporter, partial [Adlercreutzia sp.]|nr:MFS transporter [Adlercreutzia sp.]
MQETQRAPQRQNPSMGLAAAIGFGLVACVLYGVGAGLRGDIGILLTPLSEHCGLPYADVSFCIAVMNLVFGAAQPAFGLLAARRSNRFVLLCGTALLAASLVGMSVARNFWALFCSLGLLFGLGAGALAFGLILSSAMRRVGPERAMMISGMLNAAAGLGHCYHSFLCIRLLKFLCSGDFLQF